ncbi:MAG: hypothetical protein ICV53_13850 [Flavisolibacter sp.]|nr:hypothetical protein [Flavisolibacter sp.]
MRLLMILSRMALFCNLFFLPMAALHFKSYITNPSLISLFIITGYLSLFFNPVVNICYLILLIRKKTLFAYVPKWIVAVNFIFLLLQIVYFLLLNNVFLT